MSVVAGCSLFDGVLLAADCRATIKQKVYSDNVLKVFALFPHTAIGFAGHIDVASYLLRTLQKQIQKRNHTDPISLSHWFPRFFRHEFKKYTTRYGDRTVHFMIASVLIGRLNAVERKAVVELVKYIGFGKSPIKRNFMPNFLVEIMKTSD
ncbi:MAG: Ntn hydrolase family protein, partial [Planctomycetota bacterium]